jgi:arginine:ornithine antiporter/lysine permease
VLFVAAKDDDMPRFLARSNRADVPVPALLMTAIFVQVVLIVTYFSQDAFNLALDLTSALTLIPFFLVACYALKIILTRDTYRSAPQGWGKDLTIGVLATVYTLYLLFAAGVTFLLLSFIIYAPATILFVMARREQQRRVFTGPELIVFAVAIVGAVVGVVALAAGWITI